MEIISFEEAYETVMNSAFSVGGETVPFTGSLNRILEDNVTSDTDLPPFNRATVDGYACRREDLGNELDILEIIPAGKSPSETVRENQCSKIMTGAVVPEGANTVFMVEDSEITVSGRVRFTGSFTKENISLRGEDIKSGDTVLLKGTLVKPQDIAIMATVGCARVRVSRKIRIAVISSGDELVEPSEKPGPEYIRNSNAYQLMAQIDKAGAAGKYLGIVRDNEEETLKILKEALSDSDIVIITGGVSMGDFDFVPSVMERANIKLLFSRVSVQPGKPTTFGIHSNALVFGLPGNPVSSFVQFELLVRPLLYKMMGHDYKPLVLPLQMGRVFSRKAADRMGWIPVRTTDDGNVEPVVYHGSGHIASLAETDGLVALQIGKHKIEKGEVVSVRFL